MDRQNIDSAFRKTMNESPEFYSKQADLAKARIWNEISSTNNQHPKKQLIRILSAVCIALILFSTGVSISLYRTNKTSNILSEQNLKLNTQLEKSLDHKESSKFLNHTYLLQNPDTVYIEKTKTIEKPIYITNTVKDTIYLDREIYVDVEKGLQADTNKSNNNSILKTETVNAPTFTTELIINNETDNVKKKNRRFQIKIGGDYDSKENSRFVLSTKL